MGSRLICVTYWFSQSFCSFMIIPQCFSIALVTDRVCAELKQLLRAVSGYVFINPRTGSRWYDLKKAFDRARKKAGLEHIHFHDLRRSFVTNARRRGIQESVIMRMSGHKTRSVFERYNVVSEEDLRDAVKRLEEGRLSELREKSDSKEVKLSTDVINGGKNAG